MLLQRRVEIAAERSCAMKIQRCREEGRVDLLPLVEIFRGRLPIALGFLYPNHDTLMRDVRLLVMGFDADAVTLVLEGYRGLFEGNNPVTGKRVVMGDYQQLAEEHEGVAKGWVQETINVYGASQAGDIVGHMTPYHWDGDTPVMEKGLILQPEGRLAQAMVAMMNMPGASTAYMLEHGVTGLPERTDRDITIAKILCQQINGQVGLVAYEGEQGDRFEKLDAAAKEHPSFFQTFEGQGEDDR